MNYIVVRTDSCMNENYLYCIYELLKVKSSWFESNHKQIINALNKFLYTEITANSRALIGKILGQLLKQNYHVMDIVKELEDKISGSEIDIQVS